MNDTERHNTFRSNVNKNVYRIFSNKIVAYSDSGEKEIPLPVDPASFMYYLEFQYAIYENGKLFVVVATRGSYDARFELDEDTLELKWPPVSTY